MPEVIALISVNCVVCKCYMSLVKNPSITKLDYLKRHLHLHQNNILSFCILMDFPIHIDTISMVLSILTFKGS